MGDPDLTPSVCHGSFLGVPGPLTLSEGWEDKIKENREFSWRENQGINYVSKQTADSKIASILNIINLISVFYHNALVP